MSTDAVILQKCYGVLSRLALSATWPTWGRRSPWAMAR